MTLDDYAQLLDKYERLVMLVKNLITVSEYEYYDEADDYYCISCRNWKHEPHDSDCLIQLIKAEIGGVR